MSIATEPKGLTATGRRKLEDRRFNLYAVAGMPAEIAAIITGAKIAEVVDNIFNVDFPSQKDLVLKWGVDPHTRPGGIFKGKLFLVVRIM